MLVAPRACTLERGSRGSRTAARAHHAPNRVPTNGHACWHDRQRIAWLAASAWTLARCASPRAHFVVFDVVRTCVLNAPRDARALAPRAQARASRARHVQDARSTDCGSVGARHSIFASVAETRGGSRTSPACAELRSKFRAQSAAWYHTPFAIMRVDTLRVWLSDFRMEPIHFEEVTVLVFGNNNV